MMKRHYLPLAIGFSAAVFLTHCTDQASSADPGADSAVPMVPAAHNAPTPSPSAAVNPTEPVMVPDSLSSQGIGSPLQAQPIEIGQPLEVEDYPGDRPVQVIEIGQSLDADDPNAMALGMPDQSPIEIGKPLDVEGASVNELAESQQAPIEIGEPLDIDSSEVQVLGQGSSPIIEPPPHGGVSGIRAGENAQVTPSSGH